MISPSHERALTVSPTADPTRVRTHDGVVLAAPPGWALLPPGDAGLTRRVKAAGPAWTVVERRGNKNFSRGVWAPAAHIDAARGDLDVERAKPAYARRLAADAKRREVAQGEYVATFEAEVLAFLRFAPAWLEQGRALARAVTAHATPVGSGTVARTERIPVAQRAESAVIAWMRHQTTAYDSMKIARVKGERRAVRRELAEIARAVLDLHRRDATHPATCPLCRAL
jgi:hypothetical protein